MFPCVCVCRTYGVLLTSSLMLQLKETATLEGDALLLEKRCNYSSDTTSSEEEHLARAVQKLASLQKDVDRLKDVARVFYNSNSHSSQSVEDNIDAQAQSAIMDAHRHGMVRIRTTKS